MRNLENYIKNRFNPFEKMDAESLYFIGYIFADGHLTNNKDRRAYSISLFSKDKDILLKFQNFIGEKAKFYKQNNIYQVRYCSKPVIQWFSETFNIPERKALVLNPNIEINWDLLHGYFDGDGCVRMTKLSGKWNRYEAKFTTGSKIWAERIYDFLNQEGITAKIKQKGNAYDVNILGKANVYLLYKNMYASNTSKLEYKYNTFVALFGDK